MSICDVDNAKIKERFEALSRDDSQLFLNRELSWLQFNRRVLDEARSNATPLLERVKFLAILSANIDEFYMKRLGGLKQKMATGNNKPSVDGLSPSEQLNECRSVLHAIQVEKEQVYRAVRDKLLDNKIEVVQYSSLDETECALLNDYYSEVVQPLLTPWVIDRSHPFPFVSNLSLSLLVSMKRQGDKEIHLARIKVPTGRAQPRCVQVGNSLKFVLLEDIIAANVGQLFPQADIVSLDVFRVTRSAISYRDYSELDDMREMIEEELHDRKFASVVRLQVYPSMTTELRRSLAINLGLEHAKDVFESREILRMSDFMELAVLDIPQLRDSPHKPINSMALDDSLSVVDAIRRQTSIVLQHPYESFATSVERFVREASQDSKVVAIKMTLYRTSADTRIVDYLINAAGSGKQVSVVVELKARFDEAANLRWARRLEDAGVHVNYGIVGLKTHCKCILVVRRDTDRLRRYAHIGTGNYHAGTAQLYSDVGLLTCDDALTFDIGELFNYLTTGCRPDRHFNQILSTPSALKTALLSKIDHQIQKHSDSLPGYICMKTNALEDPDITIALYKASQAGVKVDLIVRDICRLRPGIAGLSENIRVVSIVGRFLEHSRLYRFGNGGDEEIYIGSADLMTRNLEKRVELLVPVRDAGPRRVLCEILNQHLQDNCCAWVMRSDGSYNRRASGSRADAINSQHLSIARAPSGPAHFCLDVMRKLTARNSSAEVAMPHRTF